jgi:hypothetical protein
MSKPVGFRAGIVDRLPVSRGMKGKTIEIKALERELWGVREVVGR